MNRDGRTSTSENRWSEPFTHSAENVSARCRNSGDGFWFRRLLGTGSLRCVNRGSRRGESFGEGETKYRGENGGDEALDHYNVCLRWAAMDMVLNRLGTVLGTVGGRQLSS
jgi:hypothetical protein